MCYSVERRTPHTEGRFELLCREAYTSHRGEAGVDVNLLSLPHAPSTARDGVIKETES